MVNKKGNVQLLSIEKKAYELASEFHAGQVDKLGVPYMEHVKAVTEGVTSTEERIVALLHDVLEDTPCTRELLLSEGIPSYLVDAIEAMTRRDDETYMDFIRRVAMNPIARGVKLSDLKHNLDEDGLRLKKASERGMVNPSKLEMTESLKGRYRTAIEYLEKL